MPSTPLSGSLAQTGGVSLAFAWMATIGLGGTLTTLVQKALSLDIYGGGWLFSLRGLILVYCYFQIPLMVIVFLPAVNGLRAQWREAAETLKRITLELGGNSANILFADVDLERAAAAAPGAVNANAGQYPQPWFAVSVQAT